jgi:hypothetical protein
MSDLEQMRTLLQQASIPFNEEVTAELWEPRPERQVGMTSLKIDSNNQPVSGGFISFFTEILFHEDGRLAAIWAWE